MDRNKILDKIKKALNLANNAGATPGEAVAALNSAQKMMAHYGVTDRELGLAGFAHEAIRTAVQAGKTFPAHMTALTSLIRKAFGVETIVHREMRRTDYNWTINYFGREDRVVMAIYTHTVLQRAVDKGWAKMLEERPYLKKERGARTGYVLGWMESVSQQVMALVVTPEEKEATLALKREMFPLARAAKPSGMRVDGEALNAGRDDGSGFALHRPMGASAAKVMLS